MRFEGKTRLVLTVLLPLTQRQTPGECLTCFLVLFLSAQERASGATAAQNDNLKTESLNETDKTDTKCHLEESTKPLQWQLCLATHQYMATMG